MRSIATIVLYAVGSPLVADVEESCRRLGVAIAGAVKNIDGPHYLLDASALREPAEIDAALLRSPCIVPLFSPANRRQAAREAMGRGFAIAPALVDPTAIVATSTSLGNGCYLNAGVVIGAAARLGEHVIVNRAASVGHHARIGDLVSIGPGVTVAGQASVERGTMVAGAVVTRDSPSGSLAVGNPARIVRDGLPLIDGGAAADQPDRGRQ